MYTSIIDPYDLYSNMNLLYQLAYNPQFNYSNNNFVTMIEKLSLQLLDPSDLIYSHDLMWLMNNVNKSVHNSNDVSRSELNAKSSEFHNSYKKLMLYQFMQSRNVMSNHPVFSSFCSTINLKIKIDELQKENIELKKQLNNKNTKIE